MSDDSQVRLPDSWELTTIGSVAAVNPPGSTVSVPDEQLVTFLPMAAVEELTGRVCLADQRPFGKVKKGFTRFRDGDVLLAKITPSMENGKVAVARDLAGGVGCGTTEFHVVRPMPGVQPDYLRYFMLRAAFRAEAKRNMQGAVGQQRVPADFVRDHTLPLAPSAEQRRIVSKIDELFSQIEEGERALERVQKLVERYRQSVLKAAITGELTREWRERHADQLESGDALLARILEARRAAWEKAELEKMKAKSITPANDKWKQKYLAPLPPDTTDLPELPAGWAWASMDQLTTKITSGSRDWKSYYGRGSSVFVMAQNVRPGRLDLTEIQHVDPPQGDRDAERSEIFQHDLLITIVGANTGDVCRVQDSLVRHYVCQSVALARPTMNSLSAFIELFLCADEGGQAQFTEEIYGAGRPHLSFDQLRATCIPVPPLKEQGAICDMVEVIQSDIAAIVAAAGKAVASAQGLRQSVLRAAFTGALVLQDSVDESASVLLDRITAVRNGIVVQPRHFRNRKKEVA